MTLVKRNNNLIFPSLLDEFFKPDWNGGIQNEQLVLPAVNIKESETDFGIEFYAPGLLKEDFNIEIDQKTLSVSDDKKFENQETTKKYSRKEFSFSAFKRNFDMPESVNIDKIEALYENGVLKINLPKREEALPKPKRVIAIG